MFVAGGPRTHWSPAVMTVDGSAVRTPIGGSGDRPETLLVWPSSGNDAAIASEPMRWRTGSVVCSLVRAGPRRLYFFFHFSKDRPLGRWLAATRRRFRANAVSIGNAPHPRSVFSSSLTHSRPMYHPEGEVRCEAQRALLVFGGESGAEHRLCGGRGTHGVRLRRGRFLNT